jgi:L-malate glycosyltransferase
MSSIYLIYYLYYDYLMSGIDTSELMTKDKSKKFILFISSWYPTKTNPLKGIFVRNHANAVAEFNTVAVLHYDPDQNQDIIDIENKINEVFVNYSTGYFSKNHKPGRIVNMYKSYMNGIKFIIKKYGKPDIVHANIAWPIGVIANRFFKKHNIPYILSEHWTAYMKENDNDFNFYQRHLIKKIFKNCSYITAVSNSLLKQMIRLGPIKNHKVVPNVIEPIFFRNKIDSSKRKNIVLHISDLNDEQKNITGLLHVAVDFLAENPDYELHIVGGSQQANEHFENIHQHERIKFIGMLSPEEIADYMTQSNMLVMFSHYESFSVVVAESIAMGLPVITTRCGGPEEFVNEKTGIVIEKNNNDALLKAMNQIKNNPQSYDRKYMKDHIEGLFSYSIIGKQFNSIYAQVLNQNL